MQRQEVEMKRVKDASMDDLMDYNNLEYREFEDAVVAKHRSLIKSDFNKTTYKAPSQTASVYFNFSDGYVDSLNSWLQFEVDISGAQIGSGAKPHFHGASALNLIKSVVLTSRSGQEICRQDKLNMYQYRNLKWSFSTSDWQTKLTSMGTRSLPDGWQANNDKVVCIPLKFLLGCFDPHDQLLLPNKLVSGARLDIEWEDAITAWEGVSSTAAPTDATYDIVDPTVFLDTVTLSDNVLDRLNKHAARGMKGKSDMGGLPISWDTFDTVKSETSSTSVNVSAKKALSKVKRAWVVLVKNDYADAKSEYLADALNGGHIAWTDYQFRLGNEYYPKLPIKGSLTSQREAFMNCQYVFGSLKHGETDVGYNADFFRLSGTPAAADKNYRVACCSLESGQIGNLDGKITSNGRSLDFNAKFAKRGADASFDIWYFVDYAVRCRVFPSKISIQE